MTGETKFRGVIGDYYTINKSPFVFPEIASKGIYVEYCVFILYHTYTRSHQPGAKHLALEQ